MPLVRPQEEIGWQSETTATEWPPVWRVVECVGCLAWGWRFEIISEGLLPVRCADCGGAKYVAERVTW